MNVVGNRMNGIVQEDVSGVEIGGSTLAERNVIAGSGQAGIAILHSDDNSANNVIQGNFIGTDATA